MNRFDPQTAMLAAMIPEGTEPNIFGSLKVPPLTEITIGHWTLRQRSYNPPLRIRGYFNGLQDVSNNWLLINRAAPDPVTWMSIMPMELESQAHHLTAANGHVLIGGLGMGVLAWNVAQKRSVTRVTVIERDQSIIDLVTQMAQRFSWSNWSKVDFVKQSMLHYASTMEYDVALIDIWPSVGDSDLRPDMQSIARNVKAREYAAWGLELDFMTWMMEEQIAPRHLQAKHWSEYSAAIEVPLIMRDERRMSRLAFQAVINSMKHETDKMMDKTGRL